MRNLIRKLDTNGDGTGETEGVVDGSATPVVFKLVPPKGYAYEINTLVVHVGCDRALFSANNYGSIAALENGVIVAVHRVSDDGISCDLTAGFPVKNNAAWGRMTCRLNKGDYGVGDRFLSAELDLKLTGSPVTLTEDEYLAVTIRDDLRDLICHCFTAYGEVIKIPQG
jgi:hypothetical protein